MKTQSLKRPVTRSDICCCCCPALCGPTDRSTPGSSVITISRSLLKFVSIELVMLSNHLIFCHPLLLLPSIFPRSETESVKDKIKTPHKKTSRTGWLYWGILTNIQRTYTDPSQTLPKDWRGNTSKVIPWSHHHPYIKIRQRHYQRRKLQANNFDKYRSKNSQQNGSDGKESAYNTGDTGSTLGLRRSPGEGNGHPL